MTETAKTTSDASRRTFLKIGAAAVGGLVVGAVAVYAAKPSTTATTTATCTTTETTTLPGTTVTSTGPGSTVTSTGPGTTVTSTAPGTTITSTATTTLPATTVTSTVTTSNTSQFISVQDQLDTQSAFLSFSTTEQAEMAAIASAIIPSDSTGPGATEAGAIYFVDRQLKNAYGTSGLVYRSEPFVPANVTTPITVDGITYPGGSVTYVNGPNTYTVTYNPTANVRVGAGSRYQYPFDMKQFWTIGLAGIEAYSNAAYGGNFETLSAANQTSCLTDLWANKPTYDGASGALSGGAAGGYQEVIEGVNSPAAGVPGGTQFGAVLPSDFAYELFFMVWNGFWVDPVYGGNKGMVGWSYVGFHGVNLGNFYGEGYTSKQLMVATTPITLAPASLGQYQKGSP
ncbi:MAG: gluconate 2-dehydrogenase subunit 3 family protein [Thaumarchaeota archaeon]|nr:gluconate 2-dehydrogenase subunit 3 family protein [Nitrososphaerota archaeon]